MAEQKKSGRRTFFAGLGLAAAAGVGAKLAANPISNSLAQTPDTGDKTKLSEHVKKYYRTTTI